jgi:hypothetical protein
MPWYCNTLQFVIAIGIAAEDVCALAASGAAASAKLSAAAIFGILMLRFPEVDVVVLAEFTTQYYT